MFLLVIINGSHFEGQFSKIERGATVLGARPTSDYGDVHRAPLVRGLRSCIAAARHRDFIIVGIVGSSAIIANQWWKRSSGRGAAAVARIYGATTRRS